jgi:hypothetical protein
MNFQRKPGNSYTKTALLFFSIIVCVFAATACEEFKETNFYEDELESGTSISVSSEAQSISLPEGMVFKIGNDLEVFNGGSAPTFSIGKPYAVTELWTYHWNGGKGTPGGGSLSLTSSEGTVYGPWTVEVRNNVYWVAAVNLTLPAGSYTVIDSDPATLAQNEQSGGQGHAWMYGTIVE